MSLQEREKLDISEALRSGIRFERKAKKDGNPTTKKPDLRRLRLWHPRMSRRVQHSS